MKAELGVAEAWWKRGYLSDVILVKYSPKIKTLVPY